MLVDGAVSVDGDQQAAARAVVSAAVPLSSRCQRPEAWKELFYRALNIPLYDSVLFNLHKE